MENTFHWVAFFYFIPFKTLFENGSVDQYSYSVYVYIKLTFMCG